MISEWTKHLSDPKDKIAFENEIRGSKRVLDRLKTIIEQKENSMNYQELSLDSYNNPNWSHKQAHNNGFRQCLASYKVLIDLDQERKPNDPNKPVQASRPTTPA